ncbi:hypothetical protein VFPPC_15705 [Pochonia chlamydosporia 170]|uniref:Uncharacterized protein n=1 Tax=Pochonia chlamydosporia 170 TaxID=1380566 RepID=A0A179FPS2_METCM|nr:hypothetical protein VFPPC_15705 [Pochonia chlamydosporia 170]OAQ67615.1 hypothetical protein VFPPC_15705 [Pochonia chlamydosporia 170]
MAGVRDNIQVCMHDSSSCSTGEKPHSVLCSSRKNTCIISSSVPPDSTSVGQLAHCHGQELNIRQQLYQYTKFLQVASFLTHASQQLVYQRQTHNLPTSRLAMLERSMNLMVTQAHALPCSVYRPDQ